MTRGDQSMNQAGATRTVTLPKRSSGLECASGSQQLQHCRNELTGQSGFTLNDCILSCRMSELEVIRVATVPDVLDSRDPYGQGCTGPAVQA